MLTLAKFKQKPDLVSAPGAALVQFHAGCTLGPALQKMSRRWGCGVDVAVRRLLVMAMSGWKLRFSDSLADLSRFVRGSEDPFQRTCLLLRKWLAAWTTATGETLSDEDVEARFAMLLDTLRERRTSGQPVDLADILAVDSDD